MTAVGFVLMFPSGEAIESEVQVGTIWLQEDLIAPYSFELLKDEEEYLLEVKARTNSVIPIFREESQVPKLSSDSAARYLEYLTGVLEADIEGREKYNSKKVILSRESYNILREYLKNNNESLRNPRGKLRSFFDFGIATIKVVAQEGILSLDYANISRDSIAIRRGNIDQFFLKRRFLDTETAGTIIRKRLAGAIENKDLLSAVTEYIVKFVAPTIVFDPELTEAERIRAAESVMRASGLIAKDERIVAKHQRISPEIKQKIDSYRASKGERSTQFEAFLQFLGKTLHVLILLMLLAIYLYTFRKKLYDDNSKLLIFSIVFLVIGYNTLLLSELDSTFPLYLLVFIPTASMLFTILFDSRVGFMTTMILALLCGGLRANDYTFVTMNIVAGTLAVYSVKDIRYRAQIFRSLLYVMLGYFVAIISFSFESFSSFESIWKQMVVASFNALISPILTFGLLVFFERFFKITTDLTYLELSSLDSVPLKEIAKKAPGTFHHSITMGQMAEAAAAEIDANPLLAYVGACYHDIGKTLLPQYFVENQLNIQNIHENLTPAESVKMILEHVEKGMEKARNYGLPEEIIEFIPTHHGTSLMSFFYDKAKKMYGEDQVNEKDFRYPGPKPRTRETGIVMLADSCESAVRSLVERDREKIEILITNLIKQKIEDRQLDETPLTFADIDKIKNAFVNVMVGQSHRRLRYPNQEALEKEVADERSSV